MKKACLIFCSLFMGNVMAEPLRVATFNVSMEATNYIGKDQEVKGTELFTHLANGNHAQIANIAAILQHVRPDIILLNEFDYTADYAKGVGAFINNYLKHGQGQQEAIDYPYFYTAPVNTGLDSGLDLNHDGIVSGSGDDAFGFGLYPGQYGMVLLSRYPIDEANIRTFQHFLWKDMPNNLMVTVKDEQGKDWYNKQAQAILPLSSKSHWDVPINVNGQIVHILASHPTPPVFDGPENRNGKKNHDEVRFWNDYLDSTKANYIYDDKGQYNGLKQPSRFVIVGDLNSSVDNGDSMKEAIGGLIHSPYVLQNTPHSEGGRQFKPQEQFAISYTAEWGMRADYVLPSKYGFKVADSGVFWPEPDTALAPLVADRQASSDHRLVWVDLLIQK